jgi:hypothetical protein
VSTAALKPALRSLTVLTKATGAAVCERKISVLITLPHKRAQVAADKAVLGDDLRPQLSIITEIRRKTGGLIRSKLHAVRLCQGGPHAPPLEDIAIGEVENVNGRIGDVSDVIAREQRLTDGTLVTHRSTGMNSKSRPLGRRGLRREMATTSRAAERKASAAATPMRPLAPATSPFSSCPPSVLRWIEGLLGSK